LTGRDAAPRGGGQTRRRGEGPAELTSEPLSTSLQNLPQPEEVVPPGSSLFTGSLAEAA
jgi:hypothetical protein